MNPNIEPSLQPAFISKSAQKKQWQADTYETCCKDITPRTISKKARELQIKVSTFSRLKKRGDNGIDFLSQKGQGKPKEFDDEDIEFIEPSLIVGKLDAFKTEMRRRLALKRNISLDKLPKKLVSSKYLCSLKQRWFDIFQTDKKSLKAKLKNSSFSFHPLNIIEQQQFACSSSCSSDNSSGINSGEENQQFSSSPSFEASQSSQCDGSDSQVQSFSIGDINSHLENLEFSENSCSLVFSQGHSGDFNSNNSTTSNDCQSSHQIQGDQQWPPFSMEGVDSRSGDLFPSEHSWSLDFNCESIDYINDFNHDSQLSQQNSFAHELQQSFPFQNQQSMSPLHNVESSSNLEHQASSDMSTQATDSSETSDQLQLNDHLEFSSFDNENLSLWQFLQLP